MTEDLISGGGNVFSGVAFAGEVKRAGAEVRGMGGKEGLEGGEEVGGNGGLVAGDESRGRNRAEAGAERAVDEEKGEAAVP